MHILTCPLFSAQVESRRGGRGARECCLRCWFIETPEEENRGPEPIDPDDTVVMDAGDSGCVRAAFPESPPPAVPNENLSVVDADETMDGEHRPSL